MHRPIRDSLRIATLFILAGLTSACISNGDITGSAVERAAFAGRMQEPVSARELNPPPSAVEIRAQCWMQHERDASDLDTKSAAVQRCVSERRRNSSSQ